LKRLRKKNSMTDVELKLPDRSTISCHKLILVAASPFFATMFESGMKESTQQVVQLDFSDAVTIKMIIDYFYSGEIDINVGNVQDLIAASEFLCLDDLKGHLGAFMTDQINASNCFEFYRYARKFNLGKLIPHCLEHILANFAQAFRSIETIIHLSEEELISVVSDDRLKADNEDMVFHCVVRWTNADPKKRRDAFVKIASFIRFPFCTQELLDRVPREPLMMNSACLDILSEAMSVRSPTQTPSWLPVHRSSITSGTLNLLVSSTGIYWIDEEGAHGKWRTESSNHSSFNWVPHWVTNYSSMFIQGKLFSFGGQKNGAYCSTVQSLDPIEREWKPEPPMLQPCSKPYIVHFGNKIYVLGGVDASGQTLFTQEFDPVWGTWQLKAEMPGVCQSGAAVSLNENIFVVGGAERVCFRFTPSSDTWTVLSRPTH
ncbi:hypothetical protein CAPTEDRAFT_63511, partial [Capitella teleta]